MLLYNFPVTFSCFLTPIIILQIQLNVPAVSGNVLREMSVFQTCGSVINRMTAQTNPMRRTAQEHQYCVRFLVICVTMVLCAYNLLNYAMATSTVKTVLMRVVVVVSTYC